MDLDPEMRAFAPSEVRPLRPPASHPKDHPNAVAFLALARTPLFVVDNAFYLLWALITHFLPSIDHLDRIPRSLWSRFSDWYDALLIALVVHLGRLRAYYRTVYLTPLASRTTTPAALLRERNTLLRPYALILAAFLGYLVLGRLVASLRMASPCDRCLAILPRTPHGALVDGVMCAPHPGSGSPVCLEGATVRFLPDVSVMVAHVAAHCDTVVHRKRAPSITLATRSGETLTFATEVAFQLQMLLDIIAGRWPC